jgi:predicted PurR-regulated permease PerM
MTRQNPPPPEGLEAGVPRDEARVLLHMPVDVRNMALAIIAVLAVLFVLRWASAVFVPLLLSVMFTYALAPLVDRLERWRIPRVLGAGVLMCAILGGMGGTAYALADDASNLVQTLPEAAQKLRQSLRKQPRQPESALDKVQRAAAQLEQAAAENSSSAPLPTRGVTRVQIERPHFNIKDYFWTGTMGLVGALGQAAVVCFLTFFLLVSGSTFRRKLVKIIGNRFHEKRLTVQALDEISRQMQMYLLVQVFTSVLVGVTTGLAFLWMGVEHAAVWGVVAGLLNFIPYLGTILMMAVSMPFAFLQFGEVDMALLVGFASLAIHTVQGQLLTPWLTSRASRMNPVAVFIGVLAFGWLWGVWGLLLGVPVLMAVKAVCDRVDDLKAIGELLSA